MKRITCREVQRIQIGLFALQILHFFAINAKFPRMAAAKKVTTSRARPDDNWIKRLLDYYWFKSLMLHQLWQQKKLPSLGLDLMITGSRDYYWFKSLILHQLC